MQRRWWMKPRSFPIRRLELHSSIRRSVSCDLRRVARMRRVTHSLLHRMNGTDSETDWSVVAFVSHCSRRCLRREKVLMVSRLADDCWNNSAGQCCRKSGKWYEEYLDDQEFVPGPVNQ